MVNIMQKIQSFNFKVALVNALTYTPNFRVIGSKLWKLINTKVFVVICLLGIVTGVGLTSIQADSADPMGVVYQKYLLNNSDAMKQSKGDKTHVIGGAIGAGAVNGSFGYNDIVNSAPSDKASQNTALRFATMMGTYSSFGYISTSPQGFDSIMGKICRVLVGLILILPALLQDIISAVTDVLLHVIDKINVINLLASAFSDTNFAQDFGKAVGLSKSAIKGFVSATMAFAIIMILIALMMAFRNGSSNIDRKAMSKLKGRLMTMVLLPLVLVGSATLLNDLESLPAMKAISSNASFSRYLVDDQTWAEKYNFAPNGSDATDNGGFSLKAGQFVDTSFDPYSDKAKDRIANINSHSELANATMANSSLVLSYMSMQTFSARDWLSYKGSKQADDTIGGYYTYANRGLKDDKVYDVDNVYGPSFPDSLPKAAGDSSTWNYAQAVDDYKGNGNGIVAWQDRFIWGAKNSGSKLKEYYNQAPSLEQINNTVGTTYSGNTDDPRYPLSDQTMFLVLSTQFNESGGKYYINSPARGISAITAKFDSDRADYYTVSLVGKGMYTVLALLASSLLQLVIFVALIFAILEIGILDMNIKPLRAWAKGVTLGDIEYPQAFVYYTLGIASTVVILVGVPAMFVSVMDTVSSVIASGVSKVTDNTTTASASMNLYAISIVIKFLVAGLFTIGFIKSDSFRQKIVSVYTFAWETFAGAGERLERMAQGKSVNDRKDMHEAGQKRRHDTVSRIDDTMRKVTNPISGAYDAYKAKHGDDDDDNEDDDTQRQQNAKRSSLADKLFKSRVPNREVTMPEFQKANDKKLGRAGTLLSSFTDVNPDVSSEVVDSANWAKRAVEAYRYNPTPENKKQALDAIEQMQGDVREDRDENGVDYDSMSLDDVANLRNNISSMHSVNKVPADLASAKFAQPLDEDVKSSDDAELATKQPVRVNDADEDGQPIPTDSKPLDNDVKSSTSPVAESAKHVVNAETVKNSTVTDGEVNDQTADIEPNDPKTLNRDAKENLNVTDGEITNSTNADLTGDNRKINSTADENVDVKDPIVNKSNNVDLTGDNRKISSTADETVDVKEPTISKSTQADLTGNDRVVNSTGKENINVTGGSPLNGADKTVNQTVQQQVKPDLNKSISDATQTVQQQVKPDINKGVSDVTQNVRQQVQHADTNVADTTQNIQQRVTPARVTSNLTSALGSAGAQPVIRQAVQQVAKADNQKDLTQAMKSLKDAMVKLPPEQRSGVDNIKLHDTLVSKSDALKPTSLKED